MNTKPIAACLLAASTLTLAATPAFADLANVQLASSLDGPSVPNGGDSNGTADFVAAIDGDNSRICYRLETHNVNNQTIAHIHEGTAGAPGRPLVNLQIGSDSCAYVNAALLQDIMANPSDYYVDVLSASFPKGAVRGQLTVTDGGGSLALSSN